jgi:hypothetical protein
MVRLGIRVTVSTRRRNESAAVTAELPDGTIQYYGEMTHTQQCR